MSKITFQQYIDGCSQLLEAIKNTPSVKYQYNIKRYCSLVVEQEGDPVKIALRPKDVIEIEWKYADINNPTAETIRVLESKDADIDLVYDPALEGTKLQHWLTRHAEYGDLKSV